MERRFLSIYEKKTIAASQQWRCHCCDDILDATFEIHHIIELCDGGDDELSNMCAICPRCHRGATQVALGNRVYHRYRNWEQRLKRKENELTQRERELDEREMKLIRKGHTTTVPDNVKLDDISDPLDLKQLRDVRHMLRVYVSTVASQEQNNDTTWRSKAKRGIQKAQALTDLLTKGYLPTLLAVMQRHLDEKKDIWAACDEVQQIRMKHKGWKDADYIKEIAITSEESKNRYMATLRDDPTICERL